MNFKYSIGDLVLLSPKADGYENFYGDFGIENDELGLVIECIDKQGMFTVRPTEICRAWYCVRFNKSGQELDFEEWELESL